MRHLSKKIVTSIVNTDFVWPIIKPALKASVFAFYSRKQPDDVKNTFSHLFKDLTVLNGPFKGMKYPFLDAVCSVICPKLLGSYEQELHSTLDAFKENDYSEIIDVGCAEGYYAVGLSIMFPKAKVYAYDIDASARKMCSKMASFNGVDERVEVRSNCSDEELKNFNFTRRGLIVSDCEGFEMSLFNKDNLPNLSKCDIIIETHDFINIEITTYLCNLFEHTHDVRVIKSIDDYEKAKTYHFDEAVGATLDEKLNLFREWRPFIMEWLVCTPKQ